MNKKDFAKRVLLICFGAFLSAVAINGLYLPNQLLSGGIAGIAMLLHLLFSWDTGLCTLLINIPIFIAGYFLMDKRFICFSLIGMLALSLSLKITASIPIISDNILVVLTLGGASYGFAIAIVSLQHGSCGGNDIITRILHKYFSLPLGTSTFLINISILGASIYFFGLDLTIMTLIANFVYGISLNYFTEKRFAAKALFVRSDSILDFTSTLAPFNQTEIVLYPTENAALIFIKPKDLNKIRAHILSLDSKASIAVINVESLKGEHLTTKQLQS